MNDYEASLRAVLASVEKPINPASELFGCMPRECIDEFDRMTALGYRLNLPSGEYYRDKEIR